MKEIEIWLAKNYNKEIGTLFTAEIPGSPLKDYSLTRMIEVLTSNYGAPMIRDTKYSDYEVLRWEVGEA